VRFAASNRLHVTKPDVRMTNLLPRSDRQLREPTHTNPPPDLGGAKPDEVGASPLPRRRGLILAVLLIGIVLGAGAYRLLDRSSAGRSTLAPAEQPVAHLVRAGERISIPEGSRLQWRPIRRGS
jgi:hypothetical protein